MARRFSFRRRSGSRRSGVSAGAMLKAFSAGKRAASGGRRKKGGKMLWVILGILVVAGVAFKNKIMGLFKKKD